MEVDVPTSDTSTVKVNDLRYNMLDHLSQNTEVYFKSQQINDPDLTISEKRLIAESILDKNPGCFLSRFGKYLMEKHLEYFAHLAPNNYEVNYYLQDLQSKFSKTNSKSTVRNRRLEALRRLTSESEYFSDEQMRKRNPVMYENLVGQYLTDEEKQQQQSSKNETDSFLNFLLDAIDEKEIEERLKMGNPLEEEEDSDSSSDENDIPKGQKIQLWGENYVNKEESTEKDVKRPTAITDNEKALFMNEFRSHVFSEFLNGRDSEFDYSKVDTNHDYDDLDMLEIDQQDKYFDSETPEVLSGTSSNSSISFDPPRNLTQKMEDLGK
ncbi:coiled-coil domain-containing protein 97 [Halyomorpha halys]|uniref:coiled-coil domain-containing protein 97 n=1 Tax=Halyomorpha halys TaxID=286706 RepID=UPI0006D4CF67|nr:coiled-coil domain-containing protein 97 [Halyomorpha halys]